MKGLCILRRKKQRYYKNIIILLEHVDHVVYMSVSAYRDWRFIPRLHQYVESLSKTLYPPCFGGLSSEIIIIIIMVIFKCYFSGELIALS